MQKERDKSAIEDLEQGLYSRKSISSEARERREFKERDFGVSEEWNKKKNVERSTKRKKPFLKQILIGSIIFFVGAIIFSSYFFFRVPAISPKNVEIEVQGPAVLGGGDELSLQILITNKNPVPIESADLIIEYPDGTRSAFNVDLELPRHRESLGIINPGEQVRRTVRSVLFGEENSTKNILITIEYRVQNSNAIFFNDYVYQLALSSSPLSLVVKSLEEAISGQEIKFSATISSNSSSVIKNVLLEVEYPFGFEFISSNPTAVFANRVWQLGDIPPEAEKTITFRGTLAGQDGEERIFRFVTGLESETDENSIGAAFINISESLFIKKPFITVNLALNGNTTGSYISQGGDTIRADVFLVNNLPTQVFDVEIDVTFKGDVLDRRSISVDSGFYQSINNKIIWDRETNNKLASIPSGGDSRVSFTFSPLGLSSGIPFRDPEIELDVTIRGKRLSDVNVPEEIISTLVRKVKVSSDIILTSKTLHFTGPFQNTGPLPPRAENETTYTILWSVMNSSNQISDVKVSASVPSYIEWLGVTSPSNEEITFNPIGGLVTWNLGEVSPGTGTVIPQREIAFQIKLIPSITQIGTSPVLVNTQTISGFDRFVEKTISSTRRILNTNASESNFDPSKHSKVVE